MPLSQLEKQHLLKSMHAMLRTQLTTALLAVAKHVSAQEFLRVYADVQQMNEVTKLLPAGYFSKKTAEKLFEEGQELANEGLKLVRKSDASMRFTFAQLDADLKQVVKRRADINPTGKQPQRVRE